LAGSGSMSQHLKKHFRYSSSYPGAAWVGFQHGEGRVEVPVVTCWSGAVEISPKAFLAAVHAWPVKVTCG
jgi:hypothetical protein